ncbi:MAG: response regulator transcription factor [Coriobacteriia bacterium]
MPTSGLAHQEDVVQGRRILVVDDEESILKIARHALEEAGFEVMTALDGESAEQILNSSQIDLVVLDLVLPGKSGFDVAQDIRAVSDLPIVILSAKADEVDRVLGLEMGADDYITKPFSPRELVSRVKAVLKRSVHGPERPERLAVGDLVVDTASRQVWIEGREVHLTPSEYDILVHMARHPGKPFTREALLALVTDPTGTADERSIDVHIHNLREKIESDPRSPTYLLTVRGTGYRLREA